MEERRVVRRQERQRLASERARRTAADGRKPGAGDGFYRRLPDDRNQSP